ncbi:MAG: Ni/Fe hydrogenase subunit alpha, partial [Candidatus Hodarchaeota archaeon]
MVKTIKISPVSRVEGHAKITIFLDDSDKVSDIHFNVASFRGFEKFLEGAAVERLPELTSRVCGICPHSHELASLKAIENALDVEVSDTTKKLRELLLLGQFIESHVLSVFMLSAPDFLAENPAERNVFSLAKENSDLAKRIFALRGLGTMITNTVGRRQVHGLTFIGGMPKALTEEERNKLLSTLKSSFLSVERLINLVKDLVDKNEDKIRSLGDIKTSFLSLSNENAISLYDGELRIMDPDGKTTQSFKPQEYFDYVREQVESYSYMKFPILKSGDIFRVNCLARLNINDLIDTDQANTELGEFRGKWGRPAQLTLLNHYARAIEILYSWEKAIQLLEDPLITKDDVKADVSLK